MGDGSLTQEEIDLLLKGADDVGPGAPVPTPGAVGTGGDMSPLERETVSDIIHSALNAGTQGLGLILSRGINLGQSSVDMVAQADVEREFGDKYLLFSQQSSGALNGNLALFLPVDAAGQIGAIVMGGEAPDPAAPLDSAQIATVKDAVGPMLFSVATEISVKIGSVITPMPVEVHVLSSGSVFPLREGADYLKIQIPFTIEGIVETRITLLMPVPMSKSLFRLAQSQAESAGRVGGMAGIPANSVPGPAQTGIKNVNFPSLSVGGPVSSQTNMNLLMDVQMTLTVELGRTKMYIKEILSLGEGSIIELDKLAGEPVDLLVNGKLIAKGEVVVIDENFGVRVTDIVSPVDRLKQGQST